MLLTASRDIDAASASAECVVRTHERLVEMLRPGLRLAEIDSFVARGATAHLVRKSDGIQLPRPFPARMTTPAAGEPLPPGESESG